MAALLPLSDSERCGASRSHGTHRPTIICLHTTCVISSSTLYARHNELLSQCLLPAIAVPFYNTSGFLSLECPSPWWLKFYLTSVQMLLFIWSLPQATQLEINVSLLLSSALFRLHFWPQYQGTLDSYLCLWYSHTHTLSKDTFLAVKDHV